MKADGEAKEILVISGKGGTGKTTLTASFAALGRLCVIADCDVDAADLFLLTSPERLSSEPFSGGRAPVLDAGACTGCGLCVRRCRFAALSLRDGVVALDHFACEGCGLCSRICPEGAIAMRDQVNGEWYISRTPYGPMAHAKLHVAEENSGKLVTLVRKQARLLAVEEKLGLILIDGSPGIGCPVIASLAGVDYAVAVTEPTLSGLHDLKRVAELARRFGVEVGVCVNKCDLNSEMTGRIEEYCHGAGMGIIGRIPYDRSVVEALARSEPVVNAYDSPAAKAVREIWKRVRKRVTA